MIHDNKSTVYQPMFDMAKGRVRTPAPTMAVRLWKVEYHHFAFREAVTGSQSSIFFCLAAAAATSTSLFSSEWFIFPTPDAVF
ncbi:hypothetical protein VIGAN_04426400 [Vigna angularis var. angularis]|uniref:Uncharacterized protein n=1 Tax=Vigna angularis var. angularis TaxID=157739 RepID=A0A0S3S1C5_PHAAN|nr:hypothetical protein VIGAN_04426400 [Vigna angularis var. angularis]